MKEAIKGFELSPVQKRLWDLHRKDVSLFSMAECRVDAPLEPVRLSSIVRQLVQSTPVLKSSFELMEGVQHPLMVEAAATRDLRLIYSGPSESDGVEVVRKAIDEALDEVSSLRERYAFIVVPTGTASFTLYIICSAITADIHSVIGFADAIATSYLTAEPPIAKSIPYSKYASWHNEVIRSEEAMEASEEYKLSESHLQQKLSFELSGSSRYGAPWTFESWEIDRTQYQALTQQSYSLGVSPQLILLATWKFILWNLSQRGRALAINVNVNGRSHEMLEDIAGFVSYNLPSITEFSESNSFREFLASLSLAMERLSEDQEFIDWTRILPASISSTLPFGFSHTITTEKDPRYSIENTKWNADASGLQLLCHETRTSVKCSLSYQQSAYRPQDIAYLSEYFMALLKIILDDPNVTLKHLSEMPHEHRERLLSKFNQTSVDFEPLPVIQLFDRAAKSYPDNIALHYKSSITSYRDAAIKAERIAAVLKSDFKIGSGDVVGVKIGRSDDLIIVILGILKSGAAFLPLPVSMPVERLKYVLTDSRAKLLISSAEEKIATCKCIDLGYLMAIEKIAPVHVKGPSKDDLCYVIYTSGSTGSPKGVSVGNLSVANYVQWFQRTINLTHNDSTLLASSVAFDLGYTSLWPALCSGATLHILPEEPVFNPEILTSILEHHKITYVKLTPTQFSLIVNDTDFSQKVKNHTARCIVLGGEQINTNDIATYSHHRPDTLFINHYGPTETTIGVITHKITNSTLKEYRQKPVIGRPISNTEVLILDDAKNAVPVGVAGEIHISGTALAKGYLNNDALTNEKFMAHPWKANSRMYATGDMGRWTAEGTVEFLGRRDFQLKIRGFRVEPGEIESVFKKNPAIENVIAVMLNGDVSNSLLVVYYQSSSALPASSLRSFAEQWLPDHMLPQRYIHCSKFPLTPNGKVDRAKLPGPDSIDENADVPEQKGTTVEEALRAMWKNVLSRERVGLHDNFLDVGGHSLKAVQIASAIHKELNIKVNLRALFEHPTIHTLAKHLATLTQENFEHIPLADHGNDYELSNGQKRLWILDQFQESKSIHNIHSAYIFRNVNIALLEKAYYAVLSRHESLWTSFIVVNGEPRQRVNELVKRSFLVEDISSFQPDEQKNKSAASQAFETQFKFDLDSGMLIRCKVLAIDNTTCIVFFTMHHIISDGWSLQILAKELLVAYESLRNGRAIALPELRIQYKDYAVWANRRAKESGSIARNFWLNQFSNGIPKLSLQADFPRKNLKTYQGRYIEFLIDQQQADGLKQISNAHGCSLFMTLLSTVYVTLHRCTGDDEIVVGTVNAGRNHPDLESIVGFFVNNIALRSKIDNTISFTQFLTHVRTTVLDAFHYSWYPFDQLVEELKIPRETGRYPLFDVVLSLHNIDAKLPATPSFTVEDYPNNEVQSVFDLVIDVRDVETGLYFNLIYNRDLFKEQSVKRIEQILTSTIQAVVTNPTVAIKDITSNTHVNDQLLVVENNFFDEEF